MEDRTNRYFQREWVRTTPLVSVEIYEKYVYPIELENRLLGILKKSVDDRVPYFIKGHFPFDFLPMDKSIKEKKEWDEKVEWVKQMVARRRGRSDRTSSGTA